MRDIRSVPYRNCIVKYISCGERFERMPIVTDII